MVDPNARLQGLISESTPIFEEIADACETVTRAIRALNVLTGAGANPMKSIPHLQTAMAAFSAINALGPRLEVVVKKYHA